MPTTEDGDEGLKRIHATILGKLCIDRALHEQKSCLKIISSRTWLMCARVCVYVVRAPVPYTIAIIV